MKYLRDLIKDNNHKLVHHTQGQENRKYMSVFDYSSMHGGTYDSHRYYNNYVVDIGKKN